MARGEVDSVAELRRDVDTDGVNDCTPEGVLEVQPLTVSETAADGVTVLDPNDADTLGLTGPLCETEVVPETGGDKLALFVWSIERVCVTMDEAETENDANEETDTASRDGEDERLAKAILFDGSALPLGVAVRDAVDVGVTSRGV